MNSVRPRFQATPEVVVMDLDRDTLVYQRPRKRLLLLNPSAAAILRLCDGMRGEDEIARSLAERYPGAPSEDVTADVRRTVEELVDLGLVTRN
jgi:hypothetical protein